MDIEIQSTIWDQEPKSFAPSTCSSCFNCAAAATTVIYRGKNIAKATTVDGLKPQKPERL
jgi:ferredoxin